MSEDEIRDWRKNARERVSGGGRVVHRGGVIRGKGGTLMYSPATTDQAERVDHDGSGSAVVDAPAREKGRLEPREAVRRVMADYIEWARTDRDGFLLRVKQLQATGQMQHMTAEEAATHLHDMAERLAREDVERVFGQHPEWQTKMGVVL